jgi:hypothetical protein
VGVLAVVLVWLPSSLHHPAGRSNDSATTE